MSDAVPNARGAREEKEDFIAPVLMPLPPARFYFLFGKPLETGTLPGRGKEKEAVEKMYQEVWKEGGKEGGKEGMGAEVKCVSLWSLLFPSCRVTWTTITTHPPSLPPSLPPSGQARGGARD